MLDRESELTELKKLDMSVIAAAHGFDIDRRRSTRTSVTMSNGPDKIVITKKNGVYVFFSPSSDANGSVIDLYQKLIEPGASLGKTRQALRPFLGAGYIAEVRKTHAGRFAPEIKESTLDLAGVAERYAAFSPIAKPHDWLCKERGIPFELLMSDRLRGRVQVDRRGNLAFPHVGYPGETPSDQRVLTGYELRNRGVNMFSKGGRKSLAFSNAFEQDRTLVVCESAIDMVSYLALHEITETRTFSLAGKMNPYQPALLQSAITSMREGSIIASGCDNDLAGDDLSAEIEKLVRSTGRSDLELREARPAKRGMDWNAVLLEQKLGRRVEIEAQTPAL